MPAATVGGPAKSAMLDGVSTMETGVSRKNLAAYHDHLASHCPLSIWHLFILVPLPRLPSREAGRCCTLPSTSGPNPIADSDPSRTEQREIPGSQIGYCRPDTGSGPSLCISWLSTTSIIVDSRLLFYETGFYLQELSFLPLPPEEDVPDELLESVDDDFFSPLDFDFVSVDFSFELC